MFSNLTIFQTSHQMASHAGRAQARVAMNIANADTPGFRAEHLPAFAEAYRTTAVQGLRKSRARHIQGQSHPSVRTRPAKTDLADPNGNSVSLEAEMVSAVTAQKEHSRALTIYRHGLTILRSSLGRK